MLLAGRVNRDNFPDSGWYTAILNMTVLITQEVLAIAKQHFHSIKAFSASDLTPPRKKAGDEQEVGGHNHDS